MLRTAALTLAATLSLAGLAGAQTDQASPKKTGPAVAACKAERDSLGKDAFKAKYTDEKHKRALRVCVRQHRKAAVKTCRTERRADKAAFKAKYATDGKRAIRGCLKAHLGDPVA